MKLHVSKLAMLDIEELGDYIARDSAFHAERFVTRIFSEIDQLSYAPLRFPLHGGNPQGFRKAYVQPYVIYFRVEDDEVFVERVLHGSRNAERLLR